MSNASNLTNKAKDIKEKVIGSRPLEGTAEMSSFGTTKTTVGQTKHIYTIVSLPDIAPPPMYSIPRGPLSREKFPDAMKILRKIPIATCNPMQLGILEDMTNASNFTSLQAKINLNGRGANATLLFFDRLYEYYPQLAEVFQVYADDDTLHFYAVDLFTELELTLAPNQDANPAEQTEEEWIQPQTTGNNKTTMEKENKKKNIEKENKNKYEVLMNASNDDSIESLHSDDDDAVDNSDSVSISLLKHVDDQSESVSNQNRSDAASMSLLNSFDPDGSMHITHLQRELERFESTMRSHIQKAESKMKQQVMKTLNTTRDKVVRSVEEDTQKIAEAEIFSISKFKNDIVKEVQDRIKEATTVHDSLKSITSFANTTSDSLSSISTNMSQVQARQDRLEAQILQMQHQLASMGTNRNEDRNAIDKLQHQIGMFSKMTPENDSTKPSPTIDTPTTPSRITHAAWQKNINLDGSPFSDTTLVEVEDMGNYWITSHRIQNGNVVYTGSNENGDQLQFQHRHVLRVIRSPTPTHGSPSPSTSTVREQNSTPTKRSTPIASPSILKDQYGFSHLSAHDYVISATNTRMTVLESKLASQDWNGEALDHSNARDWYGLLRSTLTTYNIPLIPWFSIQPSTELLELDPVTTYNFDTVKPVISRSIYNFFLRHKDNMFTSKYVQETLTSYQANMDGLGYLKEILTRYHHSLTDVSKDGSVTRSLTVPTFQGITLFQFIEDLIQYFRICNTWSPYTQAKYVLEQIKEDKRTAFGPAITALNTELNKYSNGTGYVPDHLLLSNIRTWLMNHLSSSEQETVASVNRTQSALTVHKTNLRGNRQPYKHSQKPYPSKNSDGSQNPNKSDVFCHACGNGGHTWKDCPVKGKMLHINEWIAKLSPDKKKEILDDYIQDRKAFNERYKKGMLARKKTRAQIAALVHTCNDDDSVDFDTMRKHIINKAVFMHDDLYYGSLDDALHDPTEPEIDDTTLDDLNVHHDESE
jgi:hypothetical protein